ncbi:unnamed protein product [Phytophthora fragariaefolia]|uniref:Unnamed protein product n=1 Tax=Phytophthora fragariaefolia TaxID=1490495 RepID=A0A9W7D7R3_9STRA|nr:unnamed protein product [Phytophthora fragariaefolia]
MDGKLARPSSRFGRILSHLANANDDLMDRMPSKLLLLYLGRPAMITRKHSDLIEAGVIAIGVIGTIVGLHPSPDTMTATRYDVDGVPITQLNQWPELMLITIHGCDRVLVDGFPKGVIGLPPLKVHLRLSRIPNLAQASATVEQFAIVPAFACTTEKVQGQTCHDGIIATPLDRRRKRRRSGWGILTNVMRRCISETISFVGLIFSRYSFVVGSTSARPVRLPARDNAT